MESVVLKVDGKELEGWEKVKITRSMEAMSGTFELSLSWKWEQSDEYKAMQAPIRQGGECAVEIGGERVITGYVDDWIPSYDATTVKIIVLGRDKTGDLVDCSVVHRSGQFRNQTLAQIAKTICDPFSIEVVDEVGANNKFARVQIEQGETAHELLTRLAKQRGVLLTSDTFGRLVITRASKQKADVSLILGENIKVARGFFSGRERFSQYTVKTTAQSFGAEWDDAAPSQVGGIKVEVVDEEVTRYRPMLIVNEEVATVAGASSRGKWERQRAIGRSNYAEYTVTGWRIPDTKKLWNFNKLVNVVDPMFEINEQKLIKSVMFSEDDQGRIAVITVVPPEAMNVPIEKEASYSTKAGSTW